MDIGDKWLAKRQRQSLSVQTRKQFGEWITESWQQLATVERRAQQKSRRGNAPPASKPIAESRPLKAYL